MRRCKDSRVRQLLAAWLLMLGGSSGWCGEPVGPAETPSGPGTIYEEGDVFVDDACGGACAPVGMVATSPWSAGIEFTLLRPHFERNPAFTTLASDGGTTETFTDTEFAYDRELAPRVWIEALTSDALGFRVIWWQFDHEAATAIGTPPQNGLGRISPPTFGNIDLSTTTPNSRFEADSALNAYTIDLELTKALTWGHCGWLTALGLRYADVQQSYRGQLFDGQDAAQGSIDFRHHVKGLGPTVALRTHRPFSRQLSVFGMARGALVLGDGESTLTAIEDQDLDVQLTTNRTTSRYDLLPIGELQLGVQWAPGCVGVYTPYVHLAMESQVWSGVGNSSSEDGNLGFFGFNVALGFDF